ncbi:MAG: copper chaperone PCu(A)C [Arhodomonas sp.]|nr:copper chaperone PCu(A)C [Arhodomonas sp.]
MTRHERPPRLEPTERDDGRGPPRPPQVHPILPASREQHEEATLHRRRSPITGAGHRPGRRVRRRRYHRRSALGPATPPALQAGAAYFRVTAEGDGDRLIGVESPVARNTMLHETVSENGNRTMRHVEQVAITPDQPLELVPGGYHVMLMGLEQGLKEGSTFPLTLVFEEAGPVEVEVQVEALDAEGPGTDH